MMPRAELVLGPVLYHWSAEVLRDFYARIADESEYDTVCVGEAVCSRRMPFFADDLLPVVERLRLAGKNVLLSSLALLSYERELAAMRALIATAPGLVEANDVAVLGELRGRPHAIGPFVNIYNEGALGFLAGQGAVRACLNPELPGSVVGALAARAALPLEVMVFGRMPLAISARCFHARAEGLSKEGCRFVCNQDADGRPVRTVDGTPFLAMNGLQTLSHRCANLLHELPQLRAMGVHAFRLSPQTGDMVATAALFRHVLDGRLEPAAAEPRLQALHPDLPFANGFWHGAPGHAWLHAPG